MNNLYEQVLFDANLPFKVIVQRLDYFKLHWHNQAEIIYVVKGSVHIHVDSEDYTIGVGQMMYIAGCEIHSINCTREENMLIALQLDTDFSSILSVLKSYVFQRKAFLQNQETGFKFTKILRQVFSQVVWEYNNLPQGYGMMIAAQVFSLIAHLIRDGYFIERANPSEVQENTFKHISAILEYVNLHYSERISLKEIAEREHFSYCHLSRLFKKVTGITFREHLSNFRLNKSIQCLRETKESTQNIALRYGFPTAKSYTTTFKAHYGMLPREYRKVYQQPANERMNTKKFLIGNENSMLYASTNDMNDLAYIYSQRDNFCVMPSFPVEANEKRYITVDTANLQGASLFHYWEVLGTCGRAVDLLRSNIREQIMQAHRQIGYQYLRFHGIFSDDMMIYNLRNDGAVIYNWHYVDLVFDFLLDNQLHPFLELSFMPSDMASSTNTIFWWGGNISKPKDMAAWSDMVSALFRHCIERYGKEEVCTWYAEVWNEPDYTNVFWEGSMEDYFAFYAQTAQAIKMVCPEIKVGGPSITHIHFDTTPWIRDFIKYCQAKAIDLDFISFHVYADCSRDFSSKGKYSFPLMSRFAYLQKDVEQTLIQTHKSVASQVTSAALAYHVTEWNVSAKPRFIIRDTAFMAAYIIHTILRCNEMVNSLAFWTVTDMIEELKAPVSPFHGGLGLMNFHGIPKPAFIAFVFLRKLGDIIVMKEDDYIVTRRTNDYQILLYNMAYFEPLSQNIDLTQETIEDRYAIFEEKPVKHYQIVLEGLTGRYKETRFEVNRQSGSAYDAWVMMGSPINMSGDEIAYLKHAATPKIASFIHEAEHELHIEASVPAHGCMLVQLTQISK